MGMFVTFLVSFETYEYVYLDKSVEENCTNIATKLLQLLRSETPHGIYCTGM